MFLLTTLSIYLLLLYLLRFTASPTGTVCSLLRPKEQIRAAHNTSEAIKCPQCDRYFKTKVLIERHLTTHLDKITSIAVYSNKKKS